METPAAARGESDVFRGGDHSDQRHAPRWTSPMSAPRKRQETSCCCPGVMHLTAGRHFSSSGIHSSRLTPQGELAALPCHSSSYHSSPPCRCIGKMARRQREHLVPHSQGKTALSCWTKGCKPDGKGPNKAGATASAADPAHPSGHSAKWNPETGLQTD